MYVKFGSNRIVFALPKIGVVIKVPNPRLVGLVRIGYDFQDGTRRNIYFTPKYIFHNSPLLFNRAKSNFRAGRKANSEEFKFFRKNKFVILRPSYFSLFGFLNIQKFGHVLDKKEFALFVSKMQMQMYELNETFHNEIHHFSNPGNYVLENGAVQLVDYHTKSVCDLIEEYASQLEKIFKI